jgi:putative transposase
MLCKARDTELEQTTQIPNKTEMVVYRRNLAPGGTYFFTVALLNRSSRLLVDHIDDLRRTFRVVRNKYPFDINAIVILPDHLHCIWMLPQDDIDYALRWREIKSNISRCIPDGENRSKGRTNKQERGIWQRRYWEHTIRDDQDLERHIDYIHYNPVKHGYVARAAEWPYSSFHRFVLLGIYPSEWGIECNVNWGSFGE